MKIILNASRSKVEMWDITYTHLRNLIPIRKNQLKTTNRYYKFRHIFRYPRIIQNIKRLKIEIKFLERELNYRLDYPEYRTFCELFVIGVNEKTESGLFIHKTVRQDESFLLAFAGWCEDHNMMVQSRKLMRLIDRIKEPKMGKIIKITKEQILNDNIGLINLPIKDQEEFI